MTFLLSYLSIFSSLMFMSMKSPLLLSITIILQTILISIIMTTFALSSWFSFMLLMVYLTGMMVIFIYVSSLASNDLFTMNKSQFIVLLILTTPVLLVMFKSSLPFLTTTNSMPMDYVSSSAMKTIKMYSKPLYLMTVFLIIYILLAMIMVVKNTSFSSGPLRSKK
uniref:NADH-ubiquinone oxidoreductase chain 6 n=1 Tax=Pseudoniphargus sp. 1-Basque TaxID=2212664 RepID=A0A345UE51_9CRUS|nr:NADH dehydrogenase subunit 6 [Pseudoniphargus sp. 1-Basque]